MLKSHGLHDFRIWFRKRSSPPLPPPRIMESSQLSQHFGASLSWKTINRLFPSARWVWTMLTHLVGALHWKVPPFSPSWATTSFNFNKSHGHFKCPKIIYHTAALQIFGEACLNKNKTFIQYHPVSNQYHYRGFEPTISHHRQPGGSILQATRLHSARPSEYPREQVLSGLAFMRIKNQITCGLRDSPWPLVSVGGAFFCVSHTGKTQVQSWDLHIHKNPSLL